MALVLKGQNDCVSCLLAVVGLGKKQETNQCLQKGYCMICEQVLGVKQADQSQREGGRCREGKLSSQKTGLQFSCLLHDLGWLSSQSGKIH